MPGTYTDYADHIDVFVKRTGPGRKGLVFPVKLFLLLKYIDLKEPQLKTIISWNHHGRSFKIHDHKQFRQIILPRFYASTSSETFRRQLSFWSFKRISATGAKNKQHTENGSYYNEKFLRSKDYLCRLIQRNEESEPLSDPAFELMKAMPPSEQHRLTAPESDDELFDLLLSSSNQDTRSRGSNNSSSVVAAATPRLCADGYPSINSCFVPLSTCSNQEASVLTHPLPKQTFDASTTNQTQTNDNEQTYDNIDLEKLLSDENEWQWRHLQPFPIGFQPPLSPGESEEMEQFMDFIRRKTRNKKIKLNNG